MSLTHIYLRTLDPSCSLFHPSCEQRRCMSSGSPSPPRRTGGWWKLIRRISPPCITLQPIPSLRPKKLRWHPITVTTSQGLMSMQSVLHRTPLYLYINHLDIQPPSSPSRPLQRTLHRPIQQPASPPVHRGLHQNSLNPSSKNQMSSSSKSTVKSSPTCQT